MMESATDSEQVPNSPPRVILYVEDNPNCRKLVERVFERRPGYCLLTAATGKDGMRLAQEHAPDLVIIDLRLPDVSGFDMLQWFRTQEKTRHVPAIAVSADALPSHIHDGIAAGFVDYITKPIDIRHFYAVIDRLTRTLDEWSTKPMTQAG